MSPSSACDIVAKVAHGELPPNPRSGASKSATRSFQFGIRSKHLHQQAEKVSVSALKVCKDSHRIRKPPLPLPRPNSRPLHAQQEKLRSSVEYRPESRAEYRAPIIIHTYSPEVIHTQPDDFMTLVQKLTGSCDTRHRLKRKPWKKSGSKKSPRPGNERTVTGTATAAVNAAVAALEQQQQQQGPVSSSGSGLNCGSPSSSEDESATVRDGLASVKQSNSPRGPLSSNCEFDSTFAATSEAPSSSENNKTKGLVKEEPVSTDTFTPVSTDSFNCFTGLKPLPKPEPGHYNYSYFYSGDINSPLPSPGFLSPGLFAGLPELSPGTAAWSQQFLDCLNGSPKLITNQPPLQRQRSAGTAAAASEGTMAALENIQAFMLA